MKNKKGNILVVFLITALAILSLAAAGYLFIQNGQLQTQIVKPASFPSPTPVSTPTPAPAPVVDPTANWKTYVNEVVAIQFKYPIEMFITERKNQNLIIVANQKYPENSLYMLGTYGSFLSVSWDANKQDVELWKNQESKVDLYKRADGTVFSRSEKVNFAGKEVIKITQFDDGNLLGGLYSTTLVYLDNKEQLIRISYANEYNKTQQSKVFVNQILSTFKFL